jgi:hypothetical protein
MQRINTSGWTRRIFIRLYTERWELSVLPIHDNKKPAVPEWNSYKTRLPTEKELNKWFVEQKAWGITVILKNKLFAVDFDLPEAYEIFKDKIPAGACIKKTPHGYHVLMRSEGTEPKTIRGGDQQWVACLKKIAPWLIVTDTNGREHAKVDFLGTDSLFNCPDSPGYEWLELYDEPVTVNLESFLEKTFGYTVPLNRISDYVKVGRGGVNDSEGWMPEILCPWHELVGDHKPSLHPNRVTGAFICHGCGKTGTFSELVEYSNSVNYKLPQYVYDFVEDFQRRQREAKKMEQAPDKANIPSEKLIFSAAEPVTVEEMPEPIVAGVIWRGAIVELYGEPGVGKSSFVTSGSVDLAIKDGDLWGDWANQHPWKQLYLDLENAVGESRRAIQTAATAIGKPEAAKLIDVAELIGRGFDISKPEWRDWLASAIAEKGYVIVWLDNLGKATGRNTIDDYEMKQVVNQELRPLVRKHNIALIVIHHTGWAKYDSSGKELPSHGKGGSSLFEDVNVCFKLKKVSKYVTRLTVEKARARQSIVRPGDEFLHYYDEASMRLAPAAWRYATQIASQLIDKLGLDNVANRLGCNKSTVSRYAHGLRQPDEAVRARLTELAKAEGILLRTTDIVV